VPCSGALYQHARVLGLFQDVEKQLRDIEQLSGVAPLPDSVFGPPPTNHRKQSPYMAQRNVMGTRGGVAEPGGVRRRRGRGTKKKRRSSATSRSSGASSHNNVPGPPNAAPHPITTSGRKKRGGKAAGPHKLTHGKSAGALRPGKGRKSHPTRRPRSASANNRNGKSRSRSRRSSAARARAAKEKRKNTRLEDMTEAELEEQLQVQLREQALLRETRHEQFRARPVPHTSKSKGPRENQIRSAFDEPMTRVEEMGAKEVRSYCKNEFVKVALKELGLLPDDVIPLSMSEWQKRSTSTLHRRPLTPSAVKLHYRHDAGKRRANLVQMFRIAKTHEYGELQRRRAKAEQVRQLKEAMDQEAARQAKLQRNQDRIKNVLLAENELLEQRRLEFEQRQKVYVPGARQPAPTFK